ncbi:hypothetical protein [Holdemania filiformis]|nr:hypothetical protein [Holdemania filiformis]
MLKLTPKLDKTKRFLTGKQRGGITGKGEPLRKLFGSPVIFAAERLGSENDGQGKI